MSWPIAGDFALFTGSAGFAMFTAAESTLVAHRAWGRVAVFGYTAAALVALVQLLLAWQSGRRTTLARWTSLPARTVVTGAAWLITVAVPLVLFAEQRAAGRGDRAQEEVLVVEAAGRRLIEFGSPYLDRAAIAALPEAERLMAYTPYHPGMALFGLPSALVGPGWITDARIWFAVVTVAALLTAGRLLTVGRPKLLIVGPSRSTLLRAFQVAMVLPLSALTLVTGGDDLPVLALCLLALVLSARASFGWAGVAVGIAAGLKLFALPLAAVLLALALTRGMRPAIGYAAGALSVPILALLPATLVSAGAVVENVLRFPLGRGLVASPARSPLPGYLIAGHVPSGRLVVLTLVGLLAVVLAAWLVRRPPLTAAAAATFCAVGLTAGICLLPATRFGYLLYPVAIAFAAPALRRKGATSLAVAAPSTESATLVH
jgi:hypothetical protein